MLRSGDPSFRFVIRRTPGYSANGMQPCVKLRNLSDECLSEVHMHRLSRLISLLIPSFDCWTVTTAQGTKVIGPRADSIDRLREAGEDLTQLMGAPDSGAPASVLSAARLLSGSVRSPADAQPFLSVVRQSFSEAKADR
jgi:hypothetical protein